MHLGCHAIVGDDQLPLEYTKDGQNISPPLEWADLPPAAKELAIVFEDVTGKLEAEPYAHWVIYGIDPDIPGLPEGFKHRTEAEEPAQARQGRNSSGNVGYDGPLGTLGRKRRYRFRLFALDSTLDFDEPPDRDQLLHAMDGHVLEEAELSATYEPNRD